MLAFYLTWNPLARSDFHCYRVCTGSREKSEWREEGKENAVQHPYVFFQYLMRNNLFSVAVNMAPGFFSVFAFNSQNISRQLFPTLSRQSKLNYRMNEAEEERIRPSVLKIWYVAWKVFKPPHFTIFPY